MMTLYIALAGGAALLHPLLITEQAASIGPELENRYIELNKWCDAPIPKVAPGDVVIYYRRNAEGVCVQHLAVGEAV